MYQRQISTGGFFGLRRDVGRVARSIPRRHPRTHEAREFLAGLVINEAEQLVHAGRGASFGFAFQAGDQIGQVLRLQALLETVGPERAPTTCVIPFVQTAA